MTGSSYYNDRLVVFVFARGGKEGRKPCVCSEGVGIGLCYRSSWWVGDHLGLRRDDKRSRQTRCCCCCCGYDLIWQPGAAGMLCLAYVAGCLFYLRGAWGWWVGRSARCTAGRRPERCQDCWETWGRSGMKGDPWSYESIGGSRAGTKRLRHLFLW